MRFGAQYTAYLLIVNSLRLTKGFHLEQRRGFLINSLLSPAPFIKQQTHKRALSTMTTFLSTTATSTNTEENAKREQYKFSWQQTMLRIKDPKLSLPYYVENFGFKLIHFYNFPQWNFSLYFLAFIPDEDSFDLVPGTAESEKYLWSCKSKCIVSC